MYISQILQSPSLHFVSRGQGAACRDGVVVLCQVASVVSDCATPWTVARQAPLFMGFSRQEHWSGLLCPPPGDLPYLGIEPMSLTSPALARRLFTSSTTWEALLFMILFFINDTLLLILGWSGKALMIRCFLSIDIK